jgi:hypothetical protein
MMTTFIEHLPYHSNPDLMKSPITPAKLSSSLYTITTDFSTIKNGTLLRQSALRFFRGKLELMIEIDQMMLKVEKVDPTASGGKAGCSNDIRVYSTGNVFPPIVMLVSWLTLIVP